MKLIWLGHGSWRVEIEDQVLLVDPWLDGNPMMADQDHGAATAGATQILVTHGHGDHTGGVAALSKAQNVAVNGMVELIGALGADGAVEGHAYNMGGHAMFGAVRASLVPASHSSSMPGHGAVGSETGFMVSGEGKTIYFSGDTGLMADMDWMGDFFEPDIGVLSAGGYYTMDMEQAAYAARRYFAFKTVIPQHYRTFPALEQSASALIEALPDVDVREPEVMVPIEL
ncbi:MAG: metal-dependent hydrolase [Pseudomonadota bacterium]